MKRIFVALYGVVAYIFFLVTFSYLMGFVWNLVVPKGIDEGAVIETSTAVAINILLVALFGLQHSVMARPGFKRWWTSVIPKEAERSTYVMMASGILALLMWGWQPVPYAVWDVEGSILGHMLFAVSAFGWLLVLVATFNIDHFQLFGVKQVAYYLLRRRLPGSEFVIRGMYHLVRHPLMLGFLIAFWATPLMTAGHLIFSLGMTVYIYVALELEERDLLEELGEEYAVYRQRTPRINPIRIP